jgi:hypothetical protein
MDDLFSSSFQRPRLILVLGIVVGVPVASARRGAKSDPMVVLREE